MSAAGTSQSCQRSALSSPYLASWPASPSLTREEQVFGYELLFRGGVENHLHGSDAEAASRNTLDSSCAWDSMCFAVPSYINSCLAANPWTGRLYPSSHLNCISLKAMCLRPTGMPWSGRGGWWGVGLRRQDMVLPVENLSYFALALARALRYHLSVLSGHAS